MADLLVITPTRGRPDSVRRLLGAWEDTATGYADLYLCVDDDDSTEQEVCRLVVSVAFPRNPASTVVQVGPRQRLAGWTNQTALANTQYPYLASFGDDHVPRTHGWDKAICDALAEMGTGIVYPDDGYEHERCPTAFAMTSNIVQTLGWMCLPTLSHLYVDIVWQNIGQALGRYRYLPDVLVEHLSTYNGKAPEDETSRDHWSDEAHERDRAAWNTFCATGGVREAAEKLRPLL